MKKAKIVIVITIVTICMAFSICGNCAEVGIISPYDACPSPSYTMTVNR